MNKEKLLLALVESMPDPLVIADTNHVVLHANRAANKIMNEGKPLEGHSLDECHNEESKVRLKEVLQMLENGQEEVQITDKSEGKQRTYMRAIRDENGKLLGYYERYMYWPKRID